MALFVASGNGGGGARSLSAAAKSGAAIHSRHYYSPCLPLPLSPRRGNLLIVSAKNRRSSTKTTEKQNKTAEVDMGAAANEVFESSAGLNGSNTSVGDDGFIMPKLPGEEKDFWEGPQWNTLGFVVEYLWGFGIIFSLIACGVAVATYNEGATDFKDTPAYKESTTQTGELLDESSSDVFESNPTEVAPSLE